MLVAPKVDLESLTESGESLGPQLWVGPTIPIVELVAPISLDLRYRTCGKPSGGIWTSSLVDGPTSDWLRWCEGEQFLDPNAVKWWRLTPKPDARLLRIDALSDFLTILMAYPHAPFLRMPNELEMDFVRLQEDGWDGVHLTLDGMGRTRLTFPHNLYTWDCESTIWFRWCFVGEPQLIRDIVTPQDSGSTHTAAAPIG